MNINRKRAGLKKRIASAKKAAKKPGKKAAVAPIGHFVEPVVLGRLDGLLAKMEMLETFIKCLSQAVVMKKRKQA